MDRCQLSARLAAGLPPSSTSSRCLRALPRAFSETERRPGAELHAIVLVAVFVLEHPTLDPVSRMRRPKPTTQSRWPWSKNLSSRTPAGSASAPTTSLLVSAIFILEPSGQTWGRPAMPPRADLCNLSTEGYPIKSGLFTRYCGACILLHASAPIVPQSGGLGVPSSNLGAPTRQIRYLGGQLAVVPGPPLSLAACNSSHFEPANATSCDTHHRRFNHYWVPLSLKSRGACLVRRLGGFRCVISPSILLSP